MDFSVYIHIPYCKSRCEYCDFFSTVSGRLEVSDSYIDSLCKEIKIRSRENSVSSWNTLYIGGGTPSLLSEKQLSKILSTLKSVNCTSDFKESTIELNPDDITSDLLYILEKNGFSRISVGIQSFNEKSLAAVKRRSSLPVILNSLDLIKNYWHGIFSADLICAIPFETQHSFLDGIKTLVSYKPEHISMYGLSIESGTPLANKIDKKEILYDNSFSDDLWDKGRKLLKSMGYEQYEVSNFCKPGFECLHNIAYWKLQSYLGFGSGAVSSIYNKDEKKSIRISNGHNLEEYIKYWSCPKTEKRTFMEKEVLDKDTEAFEYLMMGFRLTEGISIKEFEKRFGNNFLSKKEEVFLRWQKKGLLEETIKNDDRILRLNETGLDLLNKFLLELV